MLALLRAAQLGGLRRALRSAALFRARRDRDGHLKALNRLNHPDRLHRQQVKLDSFDLVAAAALLCFALERLNRDGEGEQRDHAEDDEHEDRNRNDRDDHHADEHRSPCAVFEANKRI